MKRPVFLVDFDGVWTEMRGQAEAVMNAARAHLAKLSRWHENDVEAALELARNELARQPLSCGWMSVGRLSAFADEDPYLHFNATMAMLDRLAGSGSAGCAELQHAVREAGFVGIDELGLHAFQLGSDQYLGKDGHRLRPDAIAALLALVEVADVVICTNGAGDAVARTLALHGVEVGSEARGAIRRIRGGAHKHQLTSDPARERVFATRTVAIDRGHYLRALLEERPDVIVGDVFSLDLSLPVVLRGEEPCFRGLELALMRTSFTPEWSYALTAPEAGLGVRMLHSPGELPDLARDMVHMEVEAMASSSKQHPGRCT